MKRSGSSSLEPLNNNNNGGNGGGSSPISDAQYIYEVRGDAASALDVLENSKASPSASAKDSSSSSENHRNQEFEFGHNEALLTYCLSDSHANAHDASKHATFVKQLEEMFANHNKTGQQQNDHNEKGADDGHDQSTSKYISMQQLVLGHNLALYYLITNYAEQGVSTLYTLFQGFDESVDGDELGDIKCKVAFLLLDCILASGKMDIIDDVTVLQWIEKYVSLPSTKRNESIYPLVKFRLHCYKSRSLFFRNKFENAKERDANTRVAKKEMKSAMELYHHKLAKREGASTIGTLNRGASAAVDEGASVQESVAPSIGSMSQDPLQDTLSTAQMGEGINGSEVCQLPFEMKSLRKQNQTALYLKANLEYLKGNTKKSLKLCSEAQRYGERQRDNTFEFSNVNKDETQLRNGDLLSLTDAQSAYHYNNLAIIHQAAGKFHLAMHYYAKSLGYIERIEKVIKVGNVVTVEKDGTACSVPSSKILFNSSLCAQQTSNFSAAQECMRRCVASSPTTFGEDPFCWLHMAESCIGSYTELKSKSRVRFEDSVNSEQQLSNHHLSRVVDYLNQCIYLCTDEGINMPKSRKKDYLESARVSLAYVWMELENFASVIKLADLVLKEESLTTDSCGDDVPLISIRRRSIMRMYACEAMCKLGTPSEGLKYMITVQPQHDTTLSAAHFLAMIDGSKKDGNDSHKPLTPDELTRLNHARASIHICNAMTSLSLGEIELAEEQAKSALNCLTNHASDNYMCHVAKAALIHALLCGGKVENAIKFAKTIH